MTVPFHGPCSLVRHPSPTARSTGRAARAQGLVTLSSSAICRLAGGSGGDAGKNAMGAVRACVKTCRRGSPLILECSERGGCDSRGGA